MATQGKEFTPGAEGEPKSKVQLTLLRWYTMKCFPPYVLISAVNLRKRVTNDFSM